MIENTNYRAKLNLQKELKVEEVNYNPSVRGDRTIMHKVFSGKLMASKVASKVVVEFAKTQN